MFLTARQRGGLNGKTRDSRQACGRLWTAPGNKSADQFCIREAL